MNDYGVLGFILGAGLIFFILFLAFFIVAYVLFAIGLQTLANNKGLQYPWLAWIPIVNLYLLGLLVKEESKIPYIEWILPGGTAFLSIFGDFLFGLLSIALFVINIMTLYLLYKKYSKNYIIMTVLSIILPVLSPFFVFAIRNNQ